MRGGRERGGELGGGFTRGRGPSLKAQPQPHGQHVAPPLAEETRCSSYPLTLVPRASTTAHTAPLPRGVTRAFDPRIAPFVASCVPTRVPISRLELIQTRGMGYTRLAER